MAEEILAAHAEAVSALTIIPGSGGIFVITAGGRKVFSKKDAGRFPESGEAARVVGQVL